MVAKTPAKKRGTASKKSASKKTPERAAAARDGADPRFFPVEKALARAPGFSLMESKSKALRGMMYRGKSIGMSSHGRFILKMNEEEVAVLTAEGTGKPFSPGPGKVMKGWIEITSKDADWVALAKRALALASGGTKKGKVRKSG